MDNELRVVAVDNKLDIAELFQQTPKCDIKLHREITDKLGFIDGDLIEINGKRMTAARVISTDKDSFDGDSIGLNDLVRNNAQVSSGDTVTIRKIEPILARAIKLAPIGKHLRRSELLRIVAKKSFSNTPFVKGDVTFLRSKILSYLLGSMTWLKVVQTDPDGVVVANYDTDYEIFPDPINHTQKELKTNNPLAPNLDCALLETNLLLTDNEWSKINSLIELGIFSTLGDAVTFLIREGINVRNDIFEETVSVMEQITQLKEHIKKNK